MAKIKVCFCSLFVISTNGVAQAELTVDPFLQPDDPRTVAEGALCPICAARDFLMLLLDITDRFDHTFIFGDLNFRLDVTRLHADWLISRQGTLEIHPYPEYRVSLAIRVRPSPRI
jgi:hypothetical protein